MLNSFKNLLFSFIFFLLMNCNPKSNYEDNSNGTFIPQVNTNNKPIKNLPNKIFVQEKKDMIQLEVSKKFNEHKRKTANNNIKVFYGEAEIIIPKGHNYYVDKEGKVLIGWHGSYNPPYGMDGRSIFDYIETITTQQILKNLNIKKLKIDNIGGTSLVNYSLFSNFNKDQKKALVIKKCNENYIINKTVGAMIGMAIGDSVGAPLEFISITELGPNQKSKFDFKTGIYSNEKNKFKLKRGQWTDDASMGLCMADSLIVNKGYNGSDIRTRFWNWWNNGYNNAFRKDNTRYKGSIGLGGNISKSLELNSNEKPSDKFHPIHTKPPYYKDDSGNGSLMRLAPIPIFYKNDIKKAIEMSKESSYATHPGYTAAEACGLLGFIIVKAINRDRNDKTNIKEFLEKTLNEYLKILEKEDEKYSTGGPAEVNKSQGINNVIRLIKSKEKENSKEYCWNWKCNTDEYKDKIKKSYYLRNQDGNYNGYPVSDTYWGSFCIDGFAMALNAIYNSDSFGLAIQNAVNLLGDADSTGSIAGQIAGAFYGFNSIYKNDKQKKLYQNISHWDDWEIPLRAVIFNEI